MKRIDGARIAQKVHQENKGRIAALAERGLCPGLAVVLVGDDSASKSYVRSKDKKAAELGLHSVKHELSADTSQQQLVSLVQELNRDGSIHGILVQSPLPSHINEQAVVANIDPAKDVDGFHPLNVAKLAMDDPSGFVPCTPLACVRLLEESNVRISGANAVIVGRSMIVGKPLALLLMRRGKAGDATVTVAHSRSRDLAAITRRAEILVAAIGRPLFLGTEHIGDQAAVLDVGINRIEDPASAKGYRLVGDVDYDAVAERCACITP
ncbi:MAG TPA: bifunctional 5,10-methylenetetrahydrofolate dehydrogenase/5,10-methenyltetrahydrofolate cyclohydrolase, partial [Terrimicrobiaceae bacterium]